MWDALALRGSANEPEAPTGTTEERRLTREYDDLLAAMEAAEAWSLDTRIQELLAGLGLTAIAGEQGLARDLATLSPGQRGRLELAATILASPSVLVLDEPTNHLDDKAARYLAGLLRDFSGPILLASHNRAFLDEVATVLLDLDTAPCQALLTASGGGVLPGVQRCAGSYTDYLGAKAAARAGHAELHQDQQEEKKRIRAHRRSAEDIAAGGARLKEAQGKEKKFFAALDLVGYTIHRFFGFLPDTRAEDLASGEYHPRRFAGVLKSLEVLVLAWRADSRL